jgi:basic membrane protein A
MSGKLYTVFLTIILTVFTVLSGCASHEPVTTETQIETVYKVVMLFDSPIADDAFSLRCLRGAEKAKYEYGIGLTICEAGTSAEAADLLKNLAASRRYDLIICIGSSQSALSLEVAGEYPEQDFAVVDGNIPGVSNVASLLSRDEESSFLAGALAAMMTETDIIGFIGGIDQPSIQRFLSGYRAGAQYINPDCNVLVSFSGNWLNDGATYALVLQQSAQGADVFFGPAGAGSLGVIKAAGEQGLYVVGVDSDQSYLAPQNVIASALKSVEVSVYEVISLAVGGNFTGSMQSVGLAEGGVGIAYNNDLAAVTSAIREEIAALQDKIISGEIVIPVD